MMTSKLNRPRKVIFSASSLVVATIILTRLNSLHCTRNTIHLHLVSILSNHSQIRPKSDLNKSLTRPWPDLDQTRAWVVFQFVACLLYNTTDLVVFIFAVAVSNKERGIMYVPKSTFINMVTQSLWRWNRLCDVIASSMIVFLIKNNMLFSEIIHMILFMLRFENNRVFFVVNSCVDFSLF